MGSLMVGSMAVMAAARMGREREGAEVSDREEACKSLCTPSTRVSLDARHRV